MTFVLNFLVSPPSNLSTDYKEESTPWEDGGSSLASQEILHIL